MSKEQDSKLKAEFMGIEIRVVKGIEGEFLVDKNTGKSVEYHSSWDWRMPVVKKIESLGYAVDIYEQECRIFEERTIEPTYNKKTFGMTKEEAVDEAITKFIKWYNNNKGV